MAAIPIAPVLAAPTIVSLSTPTLSAASVRQSIVPLSATTGTPTSYRITTLPGGGTLYVNGTAVTAARNLTPAEATRLTFTPSGTAGNYAFQFTATDATGTSVASTYNIPVSLSNCGGGSFDFSTRTVGETWTSQTNVAAGSGVTISTSGYSASAGTTRFQIGNEQGVNTAQSTSLGWYAQYSSRSTTTAFTNTTSAVTFTFSKALTGFSIVVQDIDANTTSPNFFIDQVQFDGYTSNTATTPIQLTASNVQLGSTNTFSGSNRVTGTANSAAAPSDNVVVTFPQPITRLTLTYRNTQTTTNLPTQQAIGIPAFSWCASSDIATTFTAPARAQAGSTVTYNISTTNNGADIATSVTPTLQLPTGLTNITSANGGTYNATTGLITFPTIEQMTVGAIFGNTVTFTMPVNNAVTSTATFTSPVTDNVPENNSVTLTTAQNRTPVANNVTNSPAILNTSAATAIAPLSATDPDGNATLVNYTLATLPAASEGILYVNGVAATAGQSLTPAQISQLSFAPVGTFTGNSTFTFSATDDAGVTSNVATYTVPVTAGADLSTVISGSTTGVEGQSRVYGATTTNLSSGTATNVVTTITLSNKPPFSSISVTNGSYDASTGVVTFNPVTLAGGERILQTVNFIAQPSPATVSATARSTSSTADPNTANNNGSLANATITTTVAPVGPVASATALAPCANPGRDGSPTITSNPNAYYPGTSASGSSVVIGAAATGGAQTPIAAGDLVLIIQMQGGDFNSTNTDSYGDGVAGGLASGNTNTNFTAGQYEYAVAASAVPASGGSLTLTTALRNAYATSTATSTTGQRRFQVVRVPQYIDLTLGANISSLPWNGSTGGVLVLDVAGRMSFGTTTKYNLNASGAGFRGGAGRALAGTSATGFTGTDYRTAATAAVNAMKGEGIVGTPRYVNNGSTSLDTGVEGYPNGSAGRGAPGNAGGGGTDANPTANNQNSGGGGGGNGARGGRGGNAATVNTAVGGELGSTFGPPSTSRLILGGGGGAGVSNSANGTTGYASSGAAGGGLVMLRTGSISGTGNIVANGASAAASGNDGSGGGGAGGSILVTASNTTSLGSLTLTANGGNGGSNSGTTARGPGGGGGGGIILTNAGVANATTAAGQNGVTTGSIAYGAEAGVSGLINTQVSPSIANSTAGINCSTDVVAALTGPATATAGQTVTLSAVFSNNGGVEANNVNRSITLPVVAGVQAPGAESVVTDNAAGTTTITYPALTTLAAGATNSFGFSYTAPGTLSVTATALISTASTEPVTTNNSASVTTNISGDADVTTALAGLTSLNAGRRSGIYSVVFANNGPAAATSVTRQVTLPAGINSDSLMVMDGVPYTYNPATRVLDFGTVTTLNSRVANVFRFWFVSPATGATATLSSAITTATSQGNNVAPDNFTLTAKLINVADVESRITANTPTVAPGQTGRFTVEFLNNGPSTSTGVLRRVQLPAGLQNVTANNGGSYDPATGIVTYVGTSDLVSGGNANSTITFTAPAAGPVVATANMNDGTIFSGQSNNNQATARIEVTPLADVATSLTGPTTSVAGNLVTYSVLTTNNGPSTATNVVQQVTLPANLAGVFASNGGVYNASTGVVTFPTIETLPSGAVRSNTVSLAMPTTSFAASATVATATNESTKTNNTATAATTTSTPTTTELANLYTTISFDTREVVPGAPTTFTVTTGNHGPQSAAGVVQQVVLPPGLTGVSLSGLGSYDVATGIVTFPTIETMTSGASVTNTITVNAPSSGVLLALANVSSTTSDPMPADNQQPALVTVLPVVDVATTLIGPSTASAGQQLTLTVSTINNGPIAATAVSQTVTIPAGLAAADVTATSNATYNPLTGVVTFPTLPTQAVGNVVTNTITYKTPAYRSTDGSTSTTVRNFENRATVTTTTPETVKTNNIARTITEVKWNADVAVAVSGPTANIVGNPVVYTVATINNGPAPTDTVQTTVRIVTGLTGVVASGGGVYDAATGIVTFPAIIRQPAGASGAVTNTISFIVPDRPIIGVAAVVNTSRTTNDANLTNNASTLISPVQPATATQVDMQTTITSNVSQQTAGQPVQFTVTATNAGTTAASSRSRVSLPAGLSNVVVRVGSASGTVLTNVYNPTTGNITLPIVNQAAGTTSTYTITVADPSNDPLVATASVNSTSSDPTPGNNISTVSVNIIPATDVATRLSGPASLLSGSVATYQVVTLNNGPSAASNVVQRVQLPTGLTGVIMSGGGTYDQASGIVTFPAIPTQAVGLSGEVTNTISFPFPTAAITLAASVSTSTTEVANSTANNTASLTTTLAQQPPVANTRANRLQTPQGNTADVLSVSALTGYDPNGTLTSYQILSLPDATQGVLLLNGTPVALNQTIALADVANLQFNPAAAFVGNAFFSYTTLTTEGVQSTQPGLYTITVGKDNVAVYTPTPTKGGNIGAYQDNDVLANVMDVNGSTYNSNAEITNNGVRNATLSSGSNALPNGVALDPGTGQLYVSDRNLLVSGTYTVNLTTTDAYGGITSQPVTFAIGVNPLPVELTAFTAQTQGQNAILNWKTASEVNNSHFVVERSINGRTFVAVNIVRGHGTTSQAHSYAFVDEGAARMGQQLYYRLRQVDTDSSAQYSLVRTVSFPVVTATLYPNPAAVTTTLDLRSLPAGTYHITLVDMTGRTVRQFTSQGGTEQVVEVADLPAANYLVNVQSEGTSLRLRLIKR
ncbi:DUF11 domain-containing protein [Hymenobacter defluvii]|uniref:DUF11 domain-containing protein n=2 Tax=Hymenobacter defluvii TaxID=2054411 RepID=A0ABS3TII0_9BACT|nr:DUF11 domain-containing protein [Hymenobacter defluvii]